MLFSAMVLTQLLHAFDFRSATSTVWRPSSLRNRWLVLATAGSLALQVLVIYWPAAQSVFRTVPLGFAHWLAVAGTAVVAVAVMDAAKLLKGIAKARRATATAGQAVA
jgi:magnesium-transporting ATPase (P-type)